MDIHELDAQRAAVLHAVYEETNANLFASVTRDEIAERLGFAPKDVQAAVDYWQAEGLLRWSSLSYQIAIEHAGIIEVESALRQR